MICCCCLLILLFVVVLRSKSIFFLFISLALPLSVCLRLCFVFLFSFHLFRVGLWFIRQVVVSDSKCYHNIFAFWILWCGSRLNRTALFFVSSNLLNNISSMRDEKKNHREEMGFDLGISFALSVSVSIGSQCIYRQSVNMFRLIYSFRSFRFWHRVNFITGNGLWNISVLLLAVDYRVYQCVCVRVSTASDTWVAGSIINTLLQICKISIDIVTEMTWSEAYTGCEKMWTKYSGASWGTYYICPV